MNAAAIAYIAIATGLIITVTVLLVVDNKIAEREAAERRKMQRGLRRWDMDGEEW